MEPDNSAADRGESIALMEPLIVSEGSKRRTELADLALELAAKSAGFRRSLPDGVLAALASLVRAMNCYYSNLIEGHDTHPIDIERALRNDYSADAGKRTLQLEAKAHITVQKWIDDGGLRSRATTVDGLTEVHRRFGELLPDDLLQVDDPESGEKITMAPGALRARDVKIGHHIPVSPGALPRFLERFETAYARLGKTDSILAAASAHHRLLWIHPFLDGNGRVARLMSHAMLLECLDTRAIWSIARGLARNEAAYKSQLMACDALRRGDLDGRGHLSEEALVEFSRFFLITCIDQVDFMERLVQPNRLRDRILIWTEEEIRADALSPRSGAVLEAILYRGELPRGEVARTTGTSERQARRVTAALIERGVLVSESPRAPLRLAFPARLAARWMPGLFPERTT
ncbi:MAG: Fic family protein [Alphaproteobacteria bacterium]|jgi:Fic family protein|nr:Fic family protein [Alphaproteobacteria bacterium]MDP6564675.1 Fic family protein [Alphaproteobacteria bacterium]MDP6813555.1 Fic family protein [Alphaproteobacteria bacterium]